MLVLIIHHGGLGGLCLSSSFQMDRDHEYPAKKKKWRIRINSWFYFDIKNKKFMWQPEYIHWCFLFLFEDPSTVASKVGSSHLKLMMVAGLPRVLSHDEELVEPFHLAVLEQRHV